MIAPCLIQNNFLDLANNDGDNSRESSIRGVKATCKQISIILQFELEISILTKVAIQIRVHFILSTKFIQLQ